MTPDRAPKTRRSPVRQPPRPWRDRWRAVRSWPNHWQAAWSKRARESKAASADLLNAPEAVGASRPIDYLIEDPRVDETGDERAVDDLVEDPHASTLAGPAGARVADDRPSGATGDSPATGDARAADRPTLADLLPGVIGGERPGSRAPIPWKTIWASIGIVLAAAAAIELVLILKLVIGLLVIATFFAIVLSPAVTALTRLGFRRGLATGLVFVIGLAAIGGLGYIFIHPLYREAIRLSNQVPDLLAKTQAGKGPLGSLISHYHLQKTASTEIPKIRQWLGNLGGPALSLLRTVIAGVGGIIAIAILTFLMLLEGPTIVGVILRSLPAPQSRRAARIMHDVARSVTGYVVGNTATSVIAGIICGITLAILGVPFAIVFAVWVAMVDYLPLIGGLLAGIPTVAFALLHSPTAGIITAIVFLVYQQLENHVLNPVIMSRTVKLNPLWVILSVLAGAQLASVIGALLAIPIAGAIQVVARDLWQERKARRQTDGEPSEPAGST